jgi:ABC-type dipeptide/oligopeptide/nickel transport system permease component
MIKQICKNLMSALAIIIGVHLVLFIALQSPTFGDPIARETQSSNDRTLLASAAQRLGLIDDINFAAFDLTVHADESEAFTLTIDSFFRLHDRSGQVIIEIAVPPTIGQLVANINSNHLITASVSEDFAMTSSDEIALVYFGNKVTLNSERPYHAAALHPVSSPQRFLNSLLSLLSFDFGNDRNSRPISNTLWQRGLRSLAIAAPSFFIIFIGAFMLAVSAHGRKRLSRNLNAAAILCMSLPALLYIFIIRQTFVINLEWAPLRPYGDPVLPLLILPILITVFVGIWPEYLLMRSFIDHRMRKSFIQAARAQGIGEQRIWLRHLLPNLAGPLSQHVALNLPFLVLGSLLLETIFNIPGLGISIVEAIQNHDSNMLRAITFVVAIAFLAMQAAATLVGRYFDPRQRSEGHSE